LPRKNP